MFEYLKRCKSIIIPFQANILVKAAMNDLDIASLFEYFVFICV